MKKELRIKLDGDRSLSRVAGAEAWDTTVEIVDGPAGCTGRRAVLSATSTELRELADTMDAADERAASYASNPGGRRQLVLDPAIKPTVNDLQPVFRQDVGRISSLLSSLAFSGGCPPPSMNGAFSTQERLTRVADWMVSYRDHLRNGVDHLQRQADEARKLRSDVAAVRRVLGVDLMSEEDAR